MSRSKKPPPSISAEGQNVVGMINASGKARVNVKQTVEQTAGQDVDLEKLFKQLEATLKARPEDPNVSKQEIHDQIKQIKAESSQSEKANPAKLERWIKNLAAMAPDIVDVMAASLGGPVTGFTAVIQKIAARVKAESESKK